MDLDEIDRLYEESIDKVQSKLTEGKYDATIIGAELAESRNGQPIVVWSLKTDSGHVVKSDTFIMARESEDGKPQLNTGFIKELSFFGIKPQKPLMKTLPGYLQDLVDSRVNVTVKLNDRGYPKVWFNRILKPKNFEDTLSKEDLDEAEIPF